VLVNVLENETSAYIDSKAKNITTSGLLEVKAADTLTLNNIAGVASVGAVGVSGSTNVNVINNSVMAELLSSTGQITAGNVDVNSSSTVALGINTAAIAGGGVGLSGAVAVTSIGDKFDSSDKESKMETSDSVSKTTSRANQTKVTYTKDGSSKTTADVSLAKTASSAKKGTVSKH
jgi:hypothetical protein